MAPCSIRPNHNELLGADLARTAAEFAETKKPKALFKDTTPTQAAALIGADRAEWVDLAKVLDAFNKGKIGQGHCP